VVQQGSFAPFDLSNGARYPAEERVCAWNGR
jgi:hypothetical protein